jgi:hypothetical protein
MAGALWLSRRPPATGLPDSFWQPARIREPAAGARTSELLRALSQIDSPLGGSLVVGSDHRIHKGDAFGIILFEPGVGGILVGKHFQVVDVADFLLT